MVPAENSVLFYMALRRAGVPAELHVFRTGAHGLGLAAKTPGSSLWPQCCEAWLRGRGLLDKLRGHYCSPTALSGRRMDEAAPVV